MRREGKIFDLKPELTLAMKLAATFAITYYGLLLVFEVITVVFRRYTELINAEVKPAPQELQDKHYFRKHGANAYYGQNK